MSSRTSKLLIRLSAEITCVANNCNSGNESNWSLLFDTSVSVLVAYNKLWNHRKFGNHGNPGTMATPGAMATLLYNLQLANFRPVAMYLHCHVDISLSYKNSSFSLPVSAGTGKNAKYKNGSLLSPSECWDWEECQV